MTSGVGKTAHDLLILSRRIVVNIIHVGNTDKWDGGVTDFQWYTLIDSELSNVMYRMQVVINDYPISACNGYGGKCINNAIVVLDISFPHAL